MKHDADSHVIVEAVIGLGRKLGLSVVAEGVETGDVLDTLRQLGADAVQGYFISRPVGADKIPEIVGSFAKRLPIPTRSIADPTAGVPASRRAANGRIAFDAPHAIAADRHRQ